MIIVLTLLLGALIGFSLGLTGGGGAIFAVPMLVFVLGVPAREAVGISLLTVGSTSLVGFIQRAQRGMVEFPTGFLFAVAGMIGAPIGSILADLIPEMILLISFAILMLLIAGRMWIKASDGKVYLPIIVSKVDENAGPTCKRDPEGRLRISSQCALLLGIVGLGAGVLTGMFGVGGGFIIVPALVTFACMGMQRAIGTSLLIITLISISGIASHLLAGKGLSIQISGLFTTGSIAGLFVGTWLAQRLAGPILQRVFAGAILAIATYVIFRSVV